MINVSLDQSVVNHAIDEWRHSLSACVDAEGGHFEHYLWLLGPTLKITMSKWQHCKFDNWRCLFLFSFAVNVNEQRITVFLTRKCCGLKTKLEKLPVEAQRPLSQHCSQPWIFDWLLLIYSLIQICFPWPSVCWRRAANHAHFRHRQPCGFTARRNARIVSAVLATAILSVCPSVRLSHASIVSKRLHVARCSLHCQIAKCV